jgi:hypothetical protein
MVDTLQNKSKSSARSLNLMYHQQEKERPEAWEKEKKDGKSKSKKQIKPIKAFSKKSRDLGSGHAIDRNISLYLMEELLDGSHLHVHKPIFHCLCQLQL